MATMTVTRRRIGTVATPSKNIAAARIPRELRKQAEQYLALPFAFMDSPIFHQRNVELELYNFEQEPRLR